MITLEEIKKFAKDNRACSGEYIAFTGALDNNDIKLAWQIVAINIRWLQAYGLAMDLTDIPIDIDGECTINYTYLNITYKVIPIKNKKIHGIVVVYGCNNSVKNISHYKDGIRDGESKDFYLNGKLECFCNYKNGYLHGKLKTFYINGKTASSVTYLDGERNGIYKRYWDNGKKSMVCNYVNGQLHGEVTEHYRDGKVQMREKYHCGHKIGDTLFYDRKGNIIKMVKE